jgi:hypothetical protein
MGLPLGERPAAAAAAPAAAPADEIDVERLLTASLDADRFRHERNRYLRKGRPAIVERPEPRCEKRPVANGTALTMASS